MHYFIRWLTLFAIVFVSSGEADVEKKYAGWAQATLEQMSLDEKIGQLFIVTAVSDADLLNPNFAPFFEHAIKHAGLTCKWNEYGNKETIEDLICNYNVGGVLYLGKGRFKTQIDLNNHFRALSKFPLFIAEDAEWGLTCFGDDAVGFPQTMTLGASPENHLLYEMGEEIGRQSKAIGININFAPCVDVNVNYKNPVIHQRSFGDDKHKVVSKAIAYMKGMQNAGIIACAKHFPGHGDTHMDSHLDLPRIDKTAAELTEVELFPFAKMIEAGVYSVMTAHLEVPAFEPELKKPSSLSYNVVTKLLREKMGFDGLIVTDALIMGGAAKYCRTGEVELKALLAGNDILLCPTNVPAAFAEIKAALGNGTLRVEELDAHVLRILKAKEFIMENDGFKNAVDASDCSPLKTARAVEIKEILYAQAITLCGKEEDLPAPQTSLKLIEVGKNDAFFRNQLSQHYRLVDEDQDCGNVLIAFYNIDPRDHKTYGINSNIFELIQSLKSQGKKVFIALFGSPYCLRLFDKEDTVIVGYENVPCVYQFVAEVLAGKREAVGILPVADMR